MTGDAVADAARGNWVDRWAPRGLRPYARLARWDRPIGVWLLLWPCWWSVALAGLAGRHVIPDVWNLALMFVGAVAMRGAGCTYNDIVDRKIDAAVARTRSRPIPSGQVSTRQAVAFMIAQAFAGLIVLIQFNAFAVVVGLCSLAVVALYPFAKRITDWPQAVLGLAFSWGALMGWAAAFGRLDWPAFALYGAAIAWTIGYDTIYAHQDREDDAIVGVRSTARLFGSRTKIWLAGLYGITVVLMAAAFAGAGASVIAYAGVAAFAIHLGVQVKMLDINNPDLCLAIFKLNRGAGWLPFLALLADAALRAF